MAGAGVRVFQSGEILTASQVNGYLMDQVISRFADAATRDAAFGGLGQPTLTEGRFCYLDDINEVQYYDGSVWQSAPQFALEDDAVTTPKIADSAVTTAKLSTNAVTSGKIASEAVTSAKIASAAVTESRIGVGAVTESRLATGAVTESIIASGAVTESKIGSSAVTNAKIAAGAAIDKTKISGTAVTLADTGTITSTMLGSQVVTQEKIANKAVGSGELDGITLTPITATSYTLALAEAHKLVTLNNASPITLTIPGDATANFALGTQVNLLQLGAGQVTIAGAVGVTVRSEGSKTKMNGQYALATCIKIANNEWVLVGNLTT